MTTPKTRTRKVRTHRIDDAVFPYEVTLHLSHATSRADKDGSITLEVNDPRSGRRLLDVALDSVSLATLLTRASSVPATLEHVALDNLGWYSHHDTVLIPDDKTLRDAHLDAAEHDGWTCRRDDYGNHHRHVRVDGTWHYRVTRYRLQPDKPERETNVRVENHQRAAMFGVALDVAAQHAAHLTDDERASYVREFLRTLTTSRSDE